MSRKNKIIVSIVGISIISLALIGLTYGYYLTRIQGNTNNKSISISTANLELTYSDNSDVITGANIVPGTTLGTKTFTVTNNGDNNVDSYSVGLVNVINTFTRLDDVKYTVTCSSSVTGKTCNGASESTFPNENSYIIENQINKDEVQTYVIKVEYKEMNVDQSVDMGKTLEAKIDIFDTKALTIKGTVTNSSENDYVVIHSKEQTSEIVDGKYKFIGIEPDTHKITIKNRKTTTSKQTTLNVSKGEPSASGSNITYNDEKNIADADIKITGNTVTIDVTKINDGLPTFNLDGVEFKYKEDMTWGEWLASDMSNGFQYKEKIVNGELKTGEELHPNGYTGSPYYHPYDDSYYSDCYFDGYSTIVISSGQSNFGAYTSVYIQKNSKMQQGIDYVKTGTDFKDMYYSGLYYDTCLPPNTLIEVEEEDEKGKKKRKKKKIRDIKVGDRVVCINPYTHKLDIDTVVECDSNQIKKHNCYDNWIFNDGTVITTVHRHRFYNIERQKFVYMDEWNIGECGYNINGEKIKLIEHQHIDEEIEHCTLFTEKYNNYFANGMLSGNRNSSEINL